MSNGIVDDKMRARLVAEVTAILLEDRITMLTPVGVPPILAASVPQETVMDEWEPDDLTKRVADFTGVPVEHFKPDPILVVAEKDCCGNCKRWTVNGECTLPRVGTKQLRKTAATTWCIEHDRRNV